MSNSGLSAPASPDPDLSGSSSRPESRSSISSNSMVDQAAESTSRFSSNLDDLNEVEAKSESGEVIGLDENAQSGGLLERHKDNDTHDFKMDQEDSLEMVSDDDMEANDSCKGPPTRKSPINMDPLKDTELDFEEDVTEEVKSENRAKRDEDEEGECGDKAAASGDGSQDEVEEGEELEEGEVSSEEDVGKHARMEPRPVCRFYSKGNCTWGNNCRFVHPGVLDKGNYNMFAPSRSSGHNNGPSGGYERPFDRPPVAAPMPPAEWANAGPRPGIDPRPPMRHPQALEPPRADAASGAESAWERGLRQAKEMLKKSNHRKETDIDFEEKKLNLGIGEEELDKENDYYTRPASPALHGDVPPPFEEPEVDPYNKYPAGASEGRWPRYPPQRHPPPPPHGYPYPPYEPRRGFVNEPEFRERDFYNHEGYDRHYYAHKTGGDREAHSSSKKSQPPLPPPTEKRWQDERDRYVEVGPVATQRGRGDEWWDPWMRSRSPGGGTGSAANPGAAKESRRRSYSSGSSFSTSSSTSSSSSSSYSSSSQSSSRSSASSRSSFRSKAINAKRRALRKSKVSDRVKPGKMSSTSQSTTNKHKVQQASSAASASTFPPSPPNHPTVRKITTQKPRNVPETSPARNRGWSTSSSRSRSRSPSSKHRSAAPKTNSSSQPNKSRGRSRSSSDSSSSSEWESSPHSNDNGRSRRSNRGRRDFAERKELRGGATPPTMPPLTSIKGKTSEPPKVAEVKQQIKLTLKSTVPQLKKVANKFNDDSDDEDPLAWEKSAPSDIPPLTPVTSQNQLSRKRAAESPPPATPPSKVAVSSPQKAEKGSSKKSAATRREELLKQLKAVEEAIARKRSKLPT